MTWITINEMGLHGLDGLLIYCANVWAGFTPIVLFSLFFIALLGSYFAGKRLEGDGNFFGAFFVSSFFITVISTIFTLINQTVNGITYHMINGITISAVIAIFILSLILFLTNKDK